MAENRQQELNNSFGYHDFCPSALDSMIVNCAGVGRQTWVANTTGNLDAFEHGQQQDDNKHGREIRHELRWMRVGGAHTTS